VTVHLSHMELTLSLDMYPFKFTPFDILLRMDALHPKRYCTGMDYMVRTFLAQLMVEWRVKECFYGLAGILTENDPSDCFWRSYKPELPLYQLQYENIGNMQGTYFEYKCVNWYSAGWTDFPFTNEYLETHHKGKKLPENTESEKSDEGADEMVKPEDEEANEADDEKTEEFLDGADDDAL